MLIGDVVLLVRDADTPSDGCQGSLDAGSSTCVRWMTCSPWVVSGLDPPVVNQGTVYYEGGVDICG